MPPHCVCRRGIEWNPIFVTGEARTINFGLVVTGKEALGLADRRYPHRFEIFFKKSARVVAVELAGRYRALTHFEQGAIKRPRGAHRFGAVANGATAFQERAKGRDVVVILPAVEGRKGEWFNLRIAKI